MMEKARVWSFYVGVLMAIIGGFIPDFFNELIINWTWALIMVGIIVGLLNVTAKETIGFLVAAVFMMMFGGTGKLMIHKLKYIGPIFDNFVIFVGSAALIVAIKQLYEITKSK